MPSAQKVFEAVFESMSELQGKAWLVTFVIFSHLMETASESEVVPYKTSSPDYYIVLLKAKPVQIPKKTVAEFVDQHFIL